MTVGAYVTELSAVDPVGQNFFMSGYYWLYWPTCVELGGMSCECAPLHSHHPTFFKDNGLQPYDTLFIENQGQGWALSSTLDLDNTCYDNNGMQIRGTLFELNASYTHQGTSTRAPHATLLGRGTVTLHSSLAST